MKPENKARVLERISPSMREVLAFIASQPQPMTASEDFASQRRAYTEERSYWNEGGPEMFCRQDVPVTTRWGDVATRIHKPQHNTPATLFYLHGGGFILGNLDTHDRIMRLLAHYSGCAVVGIDYSLSPEARFPQAIEEIVAVYQFYLRQGEQYGLTMSATGFAGDSAGAMLALASALWLREDHKAANIKGLLLWYGLYGLQDSASRRLYGGEWDGLRQEDLVAYENAYLGEGSSRAAPYYCLFNNVLSENVPPCFIATAEFDPLLDDSLALHRTLCEHGQPSHYQMYAGTLHAFLHYSRKMDIADRALRDGAYYFLEQLK